MRWIVHGEGFVGRVVERVVGSIGRSGVCRRALVAVVVVVIATAALLNC